MRFWPTAGVLAVASVIASGCTQRTRDSEGLKSAAIQRGDRVLVESSAAKFYEAQVVGVDTAQLRVQAVPSGDRAVVPLPDVYRLPSQTAPLAVASFAICGPQPERWLACRIVARDSAGATVVDVETQSYRLAWSQIVAPSSLTELNLKQRFDKASEQRDFQKDLARAGAPRTIPGWRPLGGKSALARMDGDWWQVVVVSEKHGKIRIRFPSSDRQIEVEPRDVAPEPPYPMEVSQGSRFALLRPTNPTMPWGLVRLISVDALEAVIESAGNKRRNAPVRDVCPLESAAPSTSP